VRQAPCHACHVEQKPGPDEGLTTRGFPGGDIDAHLRRQISLNGLKANKEVYQLNPITTLGEKLFNDKNLSASRDISCFTCHTNSSTESISLSIGTGGLGEDNGRMQGSGKVIRRNSPALFNLGHNQRFAFYDGRVSFIDGKLKTPTDLNEDIKLELIDALDAQTLFPLLSRDEMRGNIGGNEAANITNDNSYLDHLLSNRVLNQADYLHLFKTAYPDKVTFNPGHMGHALGRFIQVKYQVKNTPYDQYLEGRNSALSASAKRGFDVFLNKGKCVQCHNGVNLTDNLFHSVGTPHIFPMMSSLKDDLGRSAVTQSSFDDYKFKTPGLRNLKRTAPYMHNGTFGTLEEVVSHYNNIKGSLDNFQITSKIQENYTEEIKVDKNFSRNQRRFDQIDRRSLKRGLQLSSGEKIDLINFLESLSLSE
jgi:cytochrome c peroxidase